MLGTIGDNRSTTGESAPRRLRKGTGADVLVWAVPALLSLLVSVLCVGRAVLWRDEMASREFALLPVPELLRATAHVDGALTPYYLFLHAWTVLFGTGAVALRMPSVLAGTVAVAATARIAQRQWGSTAGVVAGTALGLNGAVLAFSVEARPYALVLAFSALATLVVLRCVDGRAPTRVLVLYAVLLAAAVLMQLLAVLLVAGHAVLFRTRGRRLARRRWSAAVAGPVLLSALIAAYSHGQDAQISWMNRPGPLNAATAALAPAGQPLHAALVAAAVLYIVLRQWRARVLDDTWLMALGVLVLPATILLAVSWVVVPILTQRYVISAEFAAALLLGSGADALATSVAAVRNVPRAVAGLLVVAVLIATSWTHLWGTARATVSWNDDNRALARVLEQQTRPGDTLVVDQGYSAGGLAAGIAYYTDDNAFAAEVSRRLPAGGPGVFWRTVDMSEPLRTATAAGPPAHGTVWLVELASTGPIDDALLKRGCAVAGAASGRAQQTISDMFLVRYRCSDSGAD